MRVEGGGGGGVSVEGQGQGGLTPDAHDANDVGRTPLVGGMASPRSPYDEAGHSTKRPGSQAH